jgi:ubiquinone/menaquinone biosynthesis C-methylase UbiE
MLSRSSQNEYSYMLNFGYWSDSATDLYQAQQNFIEEINRILPLGTDIKNGLEIGCGICGISINLLKGRNNIAMTALDISQEQLSIGKKNAIEKAVNNQITFCHGDAMNLPFDSVKFDFTVCIESTFHYQDKASFFSENFRVLRPGGYAVLADITCEDVEKVKYRHGNYFDSKQEYINNALQTGFIIESVKDIGSDVFQPLHDHITSFNRQQRLPSGKYWSVVLNNYKKLSEVGLMDYQIFLLKKPE